jgi:transketolase C-terminal domain/subunit
MVGLIEKYGPERLIDTPISENALTGMAIGLLLWAKTACDVSKNGLYVLCDGSDMQSCCHS